jgi:hypothetical protein
MRRILIAAAMALGLIALWAAILPLTAQPALPLASQNSSAMSKALFLCRTEHGIDRTCAAALAKALVLETSEHAATPASNRVCHADPQAFASVDHHD